MEKLVKSCQTARIQFCSAVFFSSFFVSARLISLFLAHPRAMMLQPVASCCCSCYSLLPASLPGCLLHFATCRRKWKRFFVVVWFPNFSFNPAVDMVEALVDEQEDLLVIQTFKMVSLLLMATDSTIILEFRFLGEAGNESTDTVMYRCPRRISLKIVILLIRPVVLPILCLLLHQGKVKSAYSNSVMCCCQCVDRWLCLMRPWCWSSPD